MRVVSLHLDFEQLLRKLVVLQTDVWSDIVEILWINLLDELSDYCLLCKFSCHKIRFYLNYSILNGEIGFPREVLDFAFD